MPIRSRFVCGAAMMLLLPLLARAQAPAGEECHLQRVAYQVADLVIPIPSVVHCSREAAPEKPPATQEDHLIKLITSTVSPKEWSDKGGCGSIDYCPATMTLVVSQTPDVQEQVADLLNSLRRLQDTEVALEVRFISASPDFVERMGLDGRKGEEIKSATPSDSPLHVTFLKDAQVVRIMEAAQGDQRTNIMQAPKMTLFNGQSADLDVTDPQDFVTGVDMRAARNGNIIFIPHLETIPVGIRMTTKPVVSADRRFVKVNLNVDLSSLDDPKADTVPIPLPSTPPGADGEPAAFTQLLQVPRITRLGMDGAFTVPDGGTAVISGWVREHTVRTENGPPVLSKVPYISRLFNNVGYGREKECVLMMVTPRIIVATEEEEKVGAAPPKAVTQCAAPVCACKHQQAMELVEKYNQACAEGKTAEATQLAVQALALDPMCFHPGAQPPALIQTTAPQK